MAPICDEFYGAQTPAGFSVPIAIPIEVTAPVDVVM